MCGQYLCSWKATPGLLPTRQRGTLATSDLRGHDPSLPLVPAQAIWKAFWQGLDRVLGLRFFDDLGAVKALSRCPCVLLSCAWCAGAGGKELWLGVGLLEHRGGLGGSWAGKLALNQRDAHYFSPSPWKAKGELVALIFSSKPGPRALYRQRWRGDPS